MTIQDAAKTAIAVQDACNLSGVARSFVEAIDAIREVMHTEGRGTSFVNTHPIVTLYLSKLASLNRTDCICTYCHNAFSRALRETEQIANSETKEVSNGI